MDLQCLRKTDARSRLPAVPYLPQILLGFAPEAPPQFEDTPALRALAAAELDMPVELLGSNGEILLERLLQDVWERQILPADAVDNVTGLTLISGDLCTQARSALRIFEDFTNLLGVPTWNPVRGADPFQVQNPAAEILLQHGVDMTQDFRQPIVDEVIVELVRKMRESVGPVSDLFTDEEIMDGITSPDLPLTARTNVLPVLRFRLSAYISACCTDGDLLRAAHHPDEPLFASGACKIQTLTLTADAGPNAFTCSEQDLGRRIHAELWQGNWSNHQRRA